MMKYRKSIFEIEKKVDLLTEYIKLSQRLEYDGVSTPYHSYQVINHLLNAVIQYWPYRDASISVDDYYQRKGIDNDNSEEQILYRIELWINLLKWVPYYEAITEEEKPRDFDEYCEIKLFLEDIYYVLGQCNLFVREEVKKDTDFSKNQYVISRRDTEVDLAVEANPKIADVLLSYMDVRSRNDLKFKRSCLLAIANYIEPTFDYYKGTDHWKYIDTLKFAFNRMSVRHENDNQIKCDDTTQIKLYDDIFRLAVNCLSFDNVDEIFGRLNNYKPH